MFWSNGDSIEEGSYQWDLDSVMLEREGKQIQVYCRTKRTQRQSRQNTKVVKHPLSLNTWSLDNIDFK